MERDWCESCGKRLTVEPIRCPICGKIVCDKCSVEYHDKDTGIDKTICKDCNMKKIKEKETQDEKQRRNDMIFYGKAIVVSIVVLIIIKLVIEWS